jgi:uncharacterized protein YbjT (DUF2867 family)
MDDILVTGGSGTLGRTTVARLRASGHPIRILSRSAAAESVGGHVGRGDLVQGDLVTGDGLAAALNGMGTVIHLATTNGKGDVKATENLVAEAERAGVRHLIVMSIVGIDEIPLGYYRAKLEVESIARESSVPHTILRSTQFHAFVEKIFAAQRWLPVVFAPTFSIQPIAVEDVAIRLTELAEGDAAGRVPDIGGPTRYTAKQLAQLWSAAAGVHRAIWPLSLPGATFAGFKAGHNLVSGDPWGTTSFESHLASRYGATG